MAAHAAKAFSWWPKVDLYPLVSVCGLAIGVLGYSSFRCITTNPDVHLTMAHKQDAAHESGITLARAQAYKPSIFRSAYQARAREGDRPDTRIMSGYN